MEIILTADWHLRKDTPICRLDEDWIETQKNILIEIKLAASYHKCPIIITGDIFDTTIIPPEILYLFIDIFQDFKSLFPFLGNHDLYYNSESNLEKSSAGILTIIYNQVKNLSFNNPQIKILHELTFFSESDRPFPDVGQTAQELLDKYPDKKWIFVGDNHKAFHYEKNGRHVVNPGCITRQAADFKDYRPSVYFVDTDKEKVEQIFLSDTKKIISDEHIRKNQERNERIGLFIEVIKTKGKMLFNFLDNIKNELNNPKINTETKQIIEELLEEVSCH